MRQAQNTENEKIYPFIRVLAAFCHSQERKKQRNLLVPGAIGAFDTPWLLAIFLTGSQHVVRGHVGNQSVVLAEHGRSDDADRFSLFDEGRNRLECPFPLVADKVCIQRYGKRKTRHAFTGTG
jgi:hypothetical protein